MTSCSIDLPQHSWCAKQSYCCFLFRGNGDGKCSKRSSGSLLPPLVTFLIVFFSGCHRQRWPFKSISVPRSGRFCPISLAISLWCMPNHLGPGRHPATVWHEAISTCFLFCCLEIKRRSTEGRWSEKWEKYEKKKGTRLRQRRILNQISRHLESLSAMGAEASSPKTRLGPPNFPAFKFHYFSRRVEGDGRLRA